MEVWSFDDLDPRQALGVRMSDGTYLVFVAEGADARTILRRLR